MDKSMYKYVHTICIKTMLYKTYTQLLKNIDPVFLSFSSCYVVQAS